MGEPLAGAAAFEELATLLSRVEATGDGSGALLAAEGRGLVLVEGGRVCWAQVPGLSRRLRDRIALRAGARLDPSDIDAVFEECRTTGEPLGEALLRRGLTTEDHLREATLEHTADAMLRLGSAQITFVPHKRRGYDARFTFSPGELLAQGGAHVDPHAAREGRLLLERQVPVRCAGFALRRRDGWPLPVAQVRVGALPVDAVRAVARWACGALDVAAALDSSREAVLGRWADGSRTVAWPRGDLVLLARSEDPSALASLVQLLALRARTG